MSRHPLVSLCFAVHLAGCTVAFPLLASRSRVVSQVEPSCGPPGTAPAVTRRVVREHGGLTEVLVGLVLDGVALFAFAKATECTGCGG